MLRSLGSTGAGHDGLELGVWRSLVAHLLWEQGVGGSNPLTPTILTVPSRTCAYSSAG
jgi:hypothetical protein